MSVSNLYFSFKAQTDLDEIGIYLDKFASLKLKEKIISSIFYRLELLKSFPGLGSYLWREKRELQNLRKIIVQKYVIIYEIREQTIIVHRIFHSARDYISLIKKYYGQ